MYNLSLKNEKWMKNLHSWYFPLCLKQVLIDASVTAESVILSWMCEVVHKTKRKRTKAKDVDRWLTNASMKTKEKDREGGNRAKRWNREEKKTLVFMFHLQIFSCTNMHCATFSGMFRYEETINFLWCFCSLRSAVLRGTQMPSFD